MKWKDINTEHPNFKKDKHVIVYMPKALQKIDIQTVYSNGRSGSCFSEGWNKEEGTFEVTHWMSLPKEPRECCDECNRTLAYCKCEPIGHQTIDFLDTTHEKPLEPVGYEKPFYFQKHPRDTVLGASLVLEMLFPELRGEELATKSVILANEFRDTIQDELHRHEAHVREKWERRIAEDIKKDYRENATNEEKMSFASGQTLARVISLITKKDV